MTRRAYAEYKPSGIDWLGDIPLYWECRRLKTVVPLKYGDPLAAEDRSPGPYPVYGSNGIIGEHDQPNTTAPCLIIGRKGSFGKVAYSCGPCYSIDTTYFIDESCSSSDLRWLYYCLQCLRLDAISKDTAVPGLSREDTYNQILPFCSLPEQQAIAAFLDRETARIDGLIEKKQRQIELLQEKRAALISHAVTKGLDPNAKMKPSGIEWLRDIPAHWKITKLSRVTKSRCDGPFGSGLKSEHYRDDGIRVVRLQNIRFARFDDTDKAFIDPEYYQQLGDHDVRPGDLLIAGLGDDNHPVGRACVAPPTISPGMVKADCFRFRIDQQVGHSEYLAMQLSTAAAALNGAFAKGTTRARTNLSDMADRPLVLPPLEEQRNITAFLDRHTALIDGLTAKVDNSIVMLREYRTALISMAVTGKLDVRREIS